MPDGEIPDSVDGSQETLHASDPSHAVVDRYPYPPRGRLGKITKLALLTISD